MCGVALWPLLNSEKQVKIATLCTMSCMSFFILLCCFVYTVLLELKQVDGNHYGSIIYYHAPHI